jgi:glycerate 2-kinase
MKIVLAPDSFKSSLTALQFYQAMAKGIQRIRTNADLVFVPMAYGGEGTVNSLIDATGGRLIRRTVTGPVGQKVEAFFGVLGDGKTAIIEMATASGLPWVPIEKRDPRITTTYGIGELILAAIAEGCTNLLLGLGGSAINDGGVGMAQALGYRFLDLNGQDLLYGGLALQNLDCIDSWIMTR